MALLRIFQIHAWKGYRILSSLDHFVYRFYNCNHYLYITSTSLVRVTSVSSKWSKMYHNSWKSLLKISIHGYWTLFKGYFNAD